MFASEEQILSVHEKDYLDELAQCGSSPLSYKMAKELLSSPEKLEKWTDTVLLEYTLTSSVPVDNPHSTYTANVSALAAGGPCRAIDMLAAGHCVNAFSILRPPGHHCHKKLAAGFCYLNNVAIAARHAQKAHNIKKIAIIDWGVYTASEIVFINLL